MMSLHRDTFLLSRCFSILYEMFSHPYLFFIRFSLQFQLFSLYFFIYFQKIRILSKKTYPK